MITAEWPMESQRTAFGETLLALGRERKDIVVVGADTTQSLKTAMFGQEYPDRLFNVGIAEQNMIGVAAGLATCGKTPFACTYSVFGTAQVYNVIRQSIAYPALNVKIFCSHAGLTVGPDGATHQMLEDIGIMRGFPNMTVLVPCDAMEMRKVVRAAAEWYGPVYARFSRARVPTITTQDDPFEIGKATVMRDGDDVTLIGTGLMVSRCLLAAEELNKQGVDARVINMSTIKPLDVGVLERAARETGGIVTAEEHTLVHGLGSAISAAVVENYPVPVKMVGVMDVFGESGTWEQLLEKYGLTVQSIVDGVHDVIKRRKEVRG